MSLTLNKHKSRVITFYSHDDNCVPQFGEACLLADFKPEFPLPFKMSDVKGTLVCGDVIWLYGKKGIARYCTSETEYYDKVMYFSADRDLKDNNVLVVCGNENEIWAKTETCVSHIVLKEITMEEKASMLLDETVKIVSREGMVSQRGLLEPWNLNKPEKDAHSDNDGGFTASFCMGEIMHYAVLKKEKGENAPETQKIRAIAMKSLEACLLLMFVAGRNDGFVARTYLTTADRLPDDGLFFYKRGGKAYVADTTYAKKKGYTGMSCDASYPVPDRLAKIYRNKGFTDDDIVFKADTSSDETTLHLMCYLLAHRILGKEDEELDEIIKTAVAGLVNHILDNGYELVDFHGEPTSWAKWSERYFTNGIGWCDAPLNAAEVLMYIKLALEVCGENEKWQNEYKKLTQEKGYADLPALHYDRAFAQAVCAGCDVNEDLMYGDHMLSNLTFFGLAMLEKDEELREKYKKGWLNWRETSIGREHHPIYDLPFMFAYPDEHIDTDKLKMWFYRYNTSSLASGVSLTSRRDVAPVEHIASYKQTSYLLPPDERPISKYDRDSLNYKNEESGGKNTVETCSPFTLPYWFGRFTGLIKEG